VRNGVRSGNQKNNKTALPKDDLSFVFLLCAAPFPGCAASGGEDMFRNKRVEMSLRMPVSPRKTRLKIPEKIFLTR